MTDDKERMARATQKRLGFAGYCRILSGIYNKPGTSEELAARFRVDRNGMNYILRSMHRMKLVHRSDWVRPKPHSVLIPVWSGGPGCDVAPIVEAKRYTSREARLSAITLGTIAESLREYPKSMLELSQDLGLHRETTIRLIRIMRDHALARIAEWERRGSGGGMPIPLYGFGRGKNATRPPRLIRAKDHASTHRSKKKHLEMIHLTAGNRRVA
jgi:hypothetical protein